MCRRFFCRYRGSVSAAARAAPVLPSPSSRRSLRHTTAPASSCRRIRLVVPLRQPPLPLPVTAVITAAPRGLSTLPVATHPLCLPHVVSASCWSSPLPIVHRPCRLLRVVPAVCSGRRTAEDLLCFSAQSACRYIDLDHSCTSTSRSGSSRLLIVLILPAPWFSADSSW